MYLKGFKLHSEALEECYWPLPAEKTYRSTFPPSISGMVFCQKDMQREILLTEPPAVHSLRARAYQSEPPCRLHQYE